mgnify:CR=1 FL=1
MVLSNKVVKMWLTWQYGIKNESFYFKPRANHYISNNGKTTAKVIWISTPPTF